MYEERERQDARVNQEETSYCLTVGGKEIYGVTYDQLRKLHETIGVFIARERNPSDYTIKNHGPAEYSVRITKSIGLYAGNDCFSVDYSISTTDSDLCDLSADQIRKVARHILVFLRAYGEGEERNIVMDQDRYPGNLSGDVSFRIRKDDRRAEFREVPHITKYIQQEDSGEIGVCYDVGVNEMRSGELSLREFLLFYESLGNLLADL